MPKKAATLARKKRNRAPAEPEGGYHHGDLQEALIAASEEILADQGAEGFTLREAARRAGVSPAAPAHHFGNAPGLLTEVAIRGYDALGAALKQAAAKKGTDHQKLHAQGLAYVDFALTYPGRFQMMFSNKRLVADDERLRKAIKAAYLEFEIVIDELAMHTPGMTPKQAKIAATVAWSTVHGFAKLALEGKFGDADADSGRREIMATLRQVLEYLWPTTARAPGR
ncbi:MAG TPA: TetR/AcrR family transcriptional regulator [Bradyrhizobium sp.]|jgi:AcrR family transcriptional regulator|nr:TetR/AcrR family transcriptional regulator [Bradyrhizobium sp.]